VNLPNPSDLIKQRVSCRNFTERKLDERTTVALQAACDTLALSPFDDVISLKVLNQHIEGVAKIGTYGTVKNPAAFLYGHCEMTPIAYCGYGYLLEKLILLATHLGLSSCWLGFYRRRSLGYDLNPPEGEAIPAIGVLGYPSDKKTVYGIVARSISAGRRRKDHRRLFFHQSFSTPFDLSAGGPIAEALEMVRIAPSAGNLQPWRIVVGHDGSAVHVYADLSESYGGLIRKSLKWIDIGIAMCHLDLVLAEQGTTGSWTIDPPKLDGGTHDTEYVASWRSD
jgi:nitroreductase